MHSLRLAFWRKPLRSETPSRSIQQGEDAPEIERTLGLFDLIMIGIGGTVGSGVFATSGLIASSYAGPAATISWFFAGVGCLLSGLTFMELACLIPSTGSTYAYAYHALGELPALIAGFLLTLEYGVSSAGGARSWSDKLTQWMNSQFGIQGPDWMKPKDSVVDLYAGLLVVGSTAIILCGMQAGKVVVNVVTMTKITVIVFIIIAGLANFDIDRVTPFVPDQSVVNVDGKDQLAFGWSGVLLGASASFYGYIGYDEVCCLAGEAKDPARNIPRAVVGTIIGAATLSILATLALVGMQRYTEINAEESYGNAFTSLKLDWAASFVATGEVLTMPITSFIAFLAQPRVQYAMAKDGLLPSIFARVDSAGNVIHGTLLSGIGVTFLAVFVPFHVLWNFISLGILVAFNLTNSSLLFLRLGTNEAEDSPSKHWHGALVIGYVLTSFIAGYHWQKGVIERVPLSSTTNRSLFDSYMRILGPFVAAFFTVIAIALMFALSDAIKTQSVSLNATAKSKDHSNSRQDVLTPDMQPDSVRTQTHGCHRRSRSIDRQADDSIDEERQEKVMMENSENEENKAIVFHENDVTDADSTTFRAPFVPYTPCIAIFFNWFLFAQMNGMSVLLILVWLLVAVVVYFVYSRHHSLAFQQSQYHQLAQQ
ncbi:amino acid-polyamine-organocation family [Plasmopara halstedii]|uniref:Amino acid-polyamine-organocation family n=1 Tax=Plasmopara halstedii TaxID=4781 RepID=A0A0P1B039_PLAHL|nr:amino acid-polyamine-organocation family [Plasmopara halstedii]CEG47728.1 amino acid-polyamine-organocation family [Plasmopara halstedii]|eukprot:XP_024584097.1 amino acid-polyamine-organocation family [Plasmopara halstedii]